MLSAQQEWRLRFIKWIISLCTFAHTSPLQMEIFQCCHQKKKNCHVYYLTKRHLRAKWNLGWASLHTLNETIWKFAFDSWCVQQQTPQFSLSRVMKGMLNHNTWNAAIVSVWMCACVDLWISHDASFYHSIFRDALKWNTWPLRPVFLIFCGKRL